MVEVADTPKEIFDGLLIRGINHFSLDALTELPCCGAEPFIGSGRDNNLSTGIHGFLRYRITDTGAAAHDHDFFVFQHSVFRLHKF